MTASLGSPKQKGGENWSRARVQPGPEEETEPEEKPWGPIRLRWRGKYLPPEVASLAFLFLLTAAFVLGVALWHAVSGFTSSPIASGADLPAQTSLSSAARSAPGSSHADRSAPNRQITALPLSKPSAALPQEPAPGTGAHPAKQAGTPGTVVVPQPPAPIPAPAAASAPVISTFVSSTQAVNAGATAILSWAVAGDTQKVIISPEPGLVNSAGQAIIHPAQSTQYVITATGPGGSASDQVFVRVNAAAAPSVDFTADRTQLKLGETATLRWSVTGADQVTIDPGIGPVNATGSVKVKPVGTTRYTLLASGSGGAAGRNLLLEINGTTGPSSGQLVWSGVVSGTQLVTIDHDHADVGTLTGALPGVPCILQPAEQHKVGIASAPSAANSFDRLVLRVIGHGKMTVIVRWSLL